eukprot:SAG31_NODE_499_length_14841_cov_7.930471_7_plen_46_part_00
MYRYRSLGPLRLLLNLNLVPEVPKFSTRTAVDLSTAVLILVVVQL